MSYFEPAGGLVSGQSSEHDSGEAEGLYPGDAGDLALDTRRVIVQLLAGPSVDGRRHPTLFAVLLRDEVIIRKRLSELFLELVLDRDLQVGFTRQADTAELEVPSLLRRAQLTFLDSVLLLFLREKLTQANAQGERAVVAKDEIVEHLTLYERSANTDRAGFLRRISGSIDKIKQRSILQKIHSSDDRFEISPTLKIVFSVEEIQALTLLYDRLGNLQEQETASGVEPEERTDI